MPELLYEYWEDDDNSGEFGPVTELGDLQRPRLMQNPRLLFSLTASSHYAGMQAFQERMDYGDYVPPDGIPDHFYTEAEQAEQEAYLIRRNVP